MAAGKLEDWAAHWCASCDAPGTIVCREGGWRNYLVCSAECGEPQWSACTVCAGAGRGPGGCHKSWYQHSKRSFHRSNLGRRGGGGEECAPCGDGDDGGDAGDAGGGGDGGDGGEALGPGHGISQPQPPSWSPIAISAAEPLEYSKGLEYSKDS